MVVIRHPIYADPVPGSPGEAALRSFLATGVDRAVGHVHTDDWTSPYTVLVRQSAAGPVPLIIPASTVLGRLSSGSLAALTKTDLYTLLQAIAVPSSPQTNDNGKIPRLDATGKLDAAVSLLPLFSRGREADLC